MKISKDSLTHFFTSLLLVAITSLSFGQVSYQFMQPLPPETEDLRSVDQKYFGVYQSDASEIKYEVSAAGIFTRNLVIHSISRETVRETSKYRIQGDYIYGIHETDSLPCVLEGENYYFGVERRDTIVAGNSKNKLRKVAANEYVISFEEGGLFTPCLIAFSGNALSIRYFDYPAEDPIFKSIKSQQTSVDLGMNTIYLLPTLKEWKKLDRSKMFGKTIDFKRSL
jgi:hypothetical protein